MKSFLDKIAVFGKLPLYAMLILIVFAALYILYDNNKANQKLLGNDLSHVETAIRETANLQAAVQREMNGVLRDSTKAIEGNTKVLQSLETKIILWQR